MPHDDFRFLDGHFLVRHKRLKDRLTASDEWTTFETQLWGQSVMEGARAHEDGGAIGAVNPARDIVAELGTNIRSRTASRAV
ncbi:MAG: hypothetical protein IH876_12850 [Gemmatimonadetes bacterium]|nr:hypothetical protein [Gemmatimonadota bacterium]